MLKQQYRSIAELQYPPEIGQVYSVPTIYKTQLRQTQQLKDSPDWGVNYVPILGSPHNDLDEAIAVAGWHVHVDWRFLAPTAFEAAAAAAAELWWAKASLTQFNLLVSEGRDTPIVWLPRRCYRELLELPKDWQLSGRVQACAGRCPHKGAWLGSIPIEEDGCRVCPQHGMRVEL